MIIRFSIGFAASSFALRLTSYALYNRALTPEKQDYIFDMMAVSEFAFVLSAFMLTYWKFPVSKLSEIARSVFRIILFAQLFTTGKELGGFNTTGEPIEKLLFCLLMLVIGYFSYTRIHKWEKKKQRTEV